MKSIRQELKEIKEDKRTRNWFYFVLLICISSRIFYFSISQYSQGHLCGISIANGLHSIGHADLCIPLSEVPDIFTNLDYTANKGYRETLKATIADNGNGLFPNSVAYALRSLFSNSSMVFYLFLCALFSIGAVYTYRLSRIFLSIKLSLWVLLLFVVNPFILEFNFNPRSYVYSVVFTIMASFYFLRIVKAKSMNPAWLLLYAISCLLAVFSHFLTIGLFIGQGIYLLLVIRSIKRINTIALISILFSLPLSVLLYFRLFPEISAVTDCQLEIYIERAKNPLLYNNFPMPLSPKTFLASFIQILKPALGVFKNWSALMSLALAVPYLGIVFLALLQTFQKKISIKPVLLFLIMSLSFMFLVSALSVLNGHNLIFQEKYGISLVVLLIVIFFFSWDKVQLNPLIKKIVLAYFVAIVGISNVYLFQYTFDQNAESANYELLAKQIENQYEEGQTVVYNSLDNAQCINLFFSQEKKIVQTVNTEQSKLFTIQ